MTDSIISLNDETLQEALNHARRGWRIIPISWPALNVPWCSAPGKQPLIKGWPNEATTDEARIRRWLKKWPSANIGIKTGEESGLVVLDVDPKNGGNESLQELIDDYSPLPDTVEVLTGGGGRHIYFKYPAGLKINDKNGSIAPGLDIKADGGFVVAPPSTHPNGKQYEWEASSHPESIELAEMPGWLLQLSINGNKNKQPDRDEKELNLPEIIPEGQRNDVLFRLASSLRRKGLERETILQMLIPVNENKCCPPLEMAELEQLVNSAGRYTPEENLVQDDNSDKYAEWRELYKNTGFTVDRWGRLCQIKATKDGSEERPLALFVARILREVVRDNGQDEDVKIIFEIDGQLPSGKTLPARMVPASEFPSMNWPLKAWGADALVLAGAVVKDALRVAIQMTGRGVQKDRIYCHSGWRRIGGKWAYLHAGGAIGSDGLHVDLSEGGQNLTRYRLPEVTPDLKEAGKSVLRLLEVADHKVTLPLMATVFLSPMCELLRLAGCDPTFLVWLYGYTGQRKSSLAAVFLSFFGTFTRDHLPGNFKDSRNMTEKIAFLLKDSLFVCDDYHPVASSRDRIEMTGKAQALLRAYGDRAARGRMSADLTLKKSYVPRGMAIITGEDLPDAGESGAARMLAVEIPRGGVNLEILSECQERAKALPGFMRGYIEWLSGRMGQTEELRNTFHELRKAAQSGSHGRLPEIVAWLTLGIRSWADFLESTESINVNQREAIIKETWDILQLLAADQAEQVKVAKPSERFITALREMMTSGAVQASALHNMDDYIGKDDRRFIGWQDVNYLYLLPGLTYKAVQQYYRDQGRELGVTEVILLKHLEADQYIETITRNGKVERSRLKKIEGEARRVIFLYKSRLGLESKENIEGEYEFLA
ncbi:MAG: hypothetical protein H6Q67_391 [Firmicutes bacterium]|nr:hypothetical protein [Bacillota bacterium]